MSNQVILMFILSEDKRWMNLKFHWISAKWFKKSWISTTKMFPLENQQTPFQSSEPWFRTSLIRVRMLRSQTCSTFGSRGGFQAWWSKFISLNFLTNQKTFYGTGTKLVNLSKPILFLMTLNRIKWQLKQLIKISNSNAKYR